MMNASIREPLRQQAVLDGIICAGLSVFSVIWVFVVRYLYHENAVSIAEAAGLCWGWFLLWSLTAALVLLLHRDEDKHLRWNLDARLLASSWPTVSIFAVVLGMRVAALAFLLGIQVLLGSLLPDPQYQNYLPYMALPLYAYLFLQAELWLQKRAPWITYGALAVGLAALGALRLQYSGPVPLDALFQRFFLHPATLVTVPLILVLLMFFGVCLERRNINFWPVRLVEWLRKTLLRRKPPASGFNAILRHEVRRIGWQLPIVTLFFTLFLVILLALITQAPLRSGFGQYLPLAALLMAALTFSRRLLPKKFPQEWESTDNSTLAAALLLAQFRALLMAAAAAGFLSLLLLWAGPTERKVFLEAHAAGVTNTLELLLTLLRPVVAAMFIAWCLSWFLIAPVGIFIVICLLLPVNMYYDPLHSILAGWIPLPVEYMCFAIVIAGTSALILHARLKQWMSRGQTLRTFGYFLTLALLVWLSSPELKGTGGALFALACASLAVEPIPAIVRAVHKRRPGAVTGTWPELNVIFQGRYWLYAGLVCLAVVFALLVVGARRAPAYVRALQAAGVPVSMEEYEPSLKGENSARLYIEAAKHLVLPDKHAEERLPFFGDLSLVYGEMLSMEETDALHRFVSDNSKSLALVLQAQQLPFTGYPEDPYAFSKRMDSLGVLTLCAALDAAFNGDTETWHQQITAALRIHEAMESGGIVANDVTIRMQCRDALRVLEYSLVYLQPAAPMVREWLALLERDRYTNFLPTGQRILKSIPEDIGSLDKLMKGTDEGGGSRFLLPTVLEWLQPLYVMRCRLVHDHLLLAKTGSGDVYQALKAYPDEYYPEELGFRYFPLFISSYSWITNAYHTHALVIARAACAKAALGTLLYLQDHRGLPETLEDLVPEYLPGVPRDPYTPDSGIRYRVSGSQLLFYSVGPDEKDDAGATDDCHYDTGDMVFRLPLPQLP